MSPSQIREQIARAMAGMRAAFRGVLGQLKPSTPIQTASVDGLAGEALPGVEVWQHFGFTSTPPDGTHVIVVPLGGRSSASVIVATEHAAYRLQLTELGEAAIYNQDGDHVWIKRGGHIELKASVAVTIDAPQTTTTGNLTVRGNVAALGTIKDKFASGGVSMDQMRDTYNGHTHGSSPTPSQAM